MRGQYPGAPVVTYVNTTAEVKAAGHLPYLSNARRSCA